MHSSAETQLSETRRPDERRHAVLYQLTQPVAHSLIMTTISFLIFIMLPHLTDPMLRNISHKPITRDSALLVMESDVPAWIQKATEQPGVTGEHSSVDGGAQILTATGVRVRFILLEMEVQCTKGSHAATLRSQWDLFEWYLDHYTGDQYRTSIQKRTTTIV